MIHDAAREVTATLSHESVAPTAGVSVCRGRRSIDFAAREGCYKVHPTHSSFFYLVNFYSSEKLRTWVHFFTPCSVLPVAMPRRGQHGSPAFTLDNSDRSFFPLPTLTTSIGRTLPAYTTPG